MTAPITPDERAAMRERYAANLPSAWATSAAAHGRALRYLGVSARDDVPRLLDALDTAEAETVRLREAARPAPVPDEDTVRAEADREALRRFVDSFCGDEAGEVEHVMSADGASGFALTGGNDAHAVLRKAASALWPGESRTTVQAEALRDAADWLARMDDGRDTGYHHAGRGIIARLRNRADRLDPKEK